jgi:Transcriptional regulators, similar to M. xanthus CarD
MKTFKPGDHVVVPGHGLVTVKRLEIRKLGPSTRPLYVCWGGPNQMTFLIPQDDPSLRPAITAAEADDVLEFLAHGKVHVDETTWNRRYGEYMEEIRKGSAFDIAGVFLKLKKVRDTKDLSFGERKMLDQARYLLTSELSHALQREVLLHDSEVDYG